MAGTRFREVLREGLGSLYREIKVACTPVPSPSKWVFLVGCYNSGTTLLAQLLSRHPDIGALPTEGHFLTDQFRKDYELGLPRMWAAREEFFRLTEDDAGPDPIRIKKEWAMRLDTTKPVFLEKSPPNTPRVRWLQRHFAPAYFVAIVRNGYAVAEGITRKADPQHLRDSWPLAQSAWQWVRSNEMLMQDEPHLQNILWIKYEDLTAHPLRELNRVCEFLSIGMLDSVDIQKPLSVHERVEPIRNLNAQSIERLTSSNIDEINVVAKEMLQRFGYTVLGAESRTSV